MSTSNKTPDDFELTGSEGLWSGTTPAPAPAPAPAPVADDWLVIADDAPPSDFAHEQHAESGDFLVDTWGGATELPTEPADGAVSDVLTVDEADEAPVRVESPTVDAGAELIEPAGDFEADPWTAAPATAADETVGFEPAESAQTSTLWGDQARAADDVPMAHPDELTDADELPEHSSSIEPETPWHDESTPFEPGAAVPPPAPTFEPEGLPEGAEGLGLKAPPIKSRGLLDKRKVMLFGGIGGLLILFAVMSALQPRQQAKQGDPAAQGAGQAGEQDAAAPADALTAITRLPATYSQAAGIPPGQEARAADPVPAAVPKLGPRPPVGGEVGAVMVGSARGTDPQSQQAAQQLAIAIEQERQQALLKQYQAARDARDADPGFGRGAMASSPAIGAASQAGGRAGIASPTLQPPTIPAMPNTGGNPDGANRQDEKNEFIQTAGSATPYLSATLMKPVNPNVVQAGTLIPIVFLTGVNSDLPGQLTAQVSQPVYDSPTGAALLIPQGTRLIGSYDSRVTFGQERVLLVWTRMIFPNGSSISLEGMPGVDMSGYAGIKGDVNNHWGHIVTAVLLSSVLSASAVESQGNVNSLNTNPRQLATQGAAQTINQAGSRLVDRQMDVQPTLTVEPGSRGAVMVDKDIALPPYDHGLQ